MDSIKYPAIILGATVSALSAVLTFRFMSVTGSAVGLSMVFGAMGVALDLSKSFLPMAISHVHKKGNAILSIFLSALCVCLMCVSFAASVFAVDAGVSDAKTSSAQYKAITNQIEHLTALAERQLEANQITKSGITQDKISRSITERNNLPASNLASEYGDQISMIVAAAIELISVAMTLIVASCPARTVDFNTERDGTPTVTAPRPASVTVLREETEEAKQITFVAKKDVEQEIKEAVIAQAVKPSIRGVREAFAGLSNTRISGVLKELGSAGVLVPKGHGWGYA